LQRLGQVAAHGAVGFLKVRERVRVDGAVARVHHVVVVLAGGDRVAEGGGGGGEEFEGFVGAGGGDDGVGGGDGGDNVFDDAGGEGVGYAWDGEFVGADEGFLVEPGDVGGVVRVENVV